MAIINEAAGALESAREGVQSARNQFSEAISGRTIEEQDKNTPSATINGMDAYLRNFIRASLKEAVSGRNNKLFNDPTTMGFNIMIDWESAESPLFNETERGESAIAYLEAINEPKRAKALGIFKRTLQDIIRRNHHYFQALEGLEGIYNFEPNVAYDTERILTITTLESIDQRIGNMIEAYQTAYFDEWNKRIMLPGNLMEFKMYVIISEIRNFRTFLENVAGIKNADGSPKQPDEMGMVNINDKINTYVFTFNRCRFVFDNVHPWLGEISNTEPEMSSNQIAVRTGRMRRSHRMGFLDLFLEDISGGEDRGVGEDTLVDPDNLDNRTAENAQRIKGTVSGRKDSRVKGTALSVETQQGNALKSELEKTQIGSFFSREAEEFAAQNDPRNVAQRQINQNIVRPFESQVKSFMFGNVFSKYSTIRGLSLDSKEARQAIADFIVGEDEPEDRLGRQNVFPEETEILSGVEQDLGIKDVGKKESGQEQELGQKETGERGEITKEDLGGEDVGEREPGQEQDLGTKTTGEMGNNTRPSLGKKDVGQRGQSVSESLGSVDAGDRSNQNPQDLGEKDTGEKSPGTSEDIGSKDTGEQGENKRQELGEVNVGDISSNVEVFMGNIEGFDEFPFSKVLEAFTKSNLGNIFGDEGGEVDV